MPIAEMLTTTVRGAALIARKSFRTVRAIIVLTKRHVPAWLGAVLTVCLFIPGPLDEFLVLLVIAGMVGFKPVMRSDLASGIREAWMR